MREITISERRRLYLLSRALVARYYRRELTLAAVANAVGCSPRQLQRTYVQFGASTFKEDLMARRMAAAAELLAGQTIPVADVARLVGYSGGSHFARAFRRRYGLSPASFRERARVRPAVPAGAHGTAALAQNVAVETVPAGAHGTSAPAQNVAG